MDVSTSSSRPAAWSDRTATACRATRTTVAVLGTLIGLAALAAFACANFALVLFAARAYDRLAARGG